MCGCSRSVARAFRITSSERMADCVAMAAASSLWQGGRKHTAPARLTSKCQVARPKPGDPRCTTVMSMALLQKAHPTQDFRTSRGDVPSLIEKRLIVDPWDLHAQLIEVCILLDQLSVRVIRYFGGRQKGKASQVGMMTDDRHPFSSERGAKERVLLFCPPSPLKVG